MSRPIMRVAFSHVARPRLGDHLADHPGRGRRARRNMKHLNHRLSAGNQQRLNIAIGLLSEPSVLLLDEPSASLDPRQRERLWEFIGSLAGRGTTGLYSTHNVSEVERYADRVLLLVDGELLFT